MLYLGKACLPRLFTEESPPMHREIAEKLQSEQVDLLNVIAPRGHAKTTITAVLFVLWHIFCQDLYRGKRPAPKFVVLVSKSRGHAINTLTTIKNILEHNQFFQAIFGYHGSQVAESWREDQIVLGNGSIITCRGWEQQIRGLNINGMRPSAIITDDIETEENTKTQQGVDKTFRRFAQAIMPAIAKGGRIVNVGTPQVQNSLVFTLEAMSEWVTLKYQAIITEDGVKRALWPQIWSLAKLQARHDSLEELGRVSSFYKEFMCEVIGDADQLFKPEYIRYWHGELKRDANGNAYIARDGYENTPVEVFMGVDPASTLSATSDFTVIFVVAMDAERNVYCIDYLRKRMKPMDVADSIISLYRKYRPAKTQIETVGYQSMISDYLKREAGVHIPGIDIKNNPRRGKTERLEGLQPQFAGGRVHLRQKHAGTNDMEDFKNELLMFPRGKHDDTIDGYFYSVKGAYRPYHDVVLSSKNPDRTLVRTRGLSSWKIV